MQSARNVRRGGAGGVQHAEPCLLHLAGPHQPAEFENFAVARDGDFLNRWDRISYATPARASSPPNSVLLTLDQSPRVVDVSPIPNNRSPKVLLSRIWGVQIHNHSGSVSYYFIFRNSEEH